MQGSGNDSRNYLKGNHRRWGIGVIPSFPLLRTSKQVAAWACSGGKAAWECSRDLVFVWTPDCVLGQSNIYEVTTGHFRGVAIGRTAQLPRAVGIDMWIPVAFQSFWCPCLCFVEGMGAGTERQLISATPLLHFEPKPQCLQRPFTPRRAQVEGFERVNSGTGNPWSIVPVVTICCNELYVFVPFWF